MDEIIIEEKVTLAKNLFKEGYNCCQAVFASCADVLDLNDRSLALRLSASFGGGMGRMRKTCGAVCGMLLLEGLRTGGDTPQWDKKINYTHVQNLIRTFENTFGSSTCLDLLKQTHITADDLPVPNKRDETYYKKRPCADLVAQAVRIFLSSIDETIPDLAKFNNNN